MVQYEYRCVIGAASGFEKKMPDTLMALGSEGWELVTIWNGWFIFKRLKTETPAETPEPGTKFANGKIKDFSVKVNNVTAKPV